MTHFKLSKDIILDPGKVYLVETVGKVPAIFISAMPNNASLFLSLLDDLYCCEVGSLTMWTSNQRNHLLEFSDNKIGLGLQRLIEKARKAPLRMKPDLEVHGLAYLVLHYLNNKDPRLLKELLTYRSDFYHYERASANNV